jgi:uncharacterized protein
VKSLEVIVKISERCNLNCSYCYFFNRGDSSFNENPALIAVETATDIARLASEACRSQGFEIVHFYLHGGEPLLYPKRRFDAFCQALINGLEPGVRYSLSIQTNGALIDQDWIDIFRTFAIAASVSLDGPAHVHDRFRIGHKGEASYEACAAGFRMLRDAFEAGALPSQPGLLAVIDPSASGAEVYRHFRDDLNAHLMDFLVPDYTRDDCPETVPGAVAHFLEEVFTEWTRDDDPDVDVRILRSAVQISMGRPSGLMGLGATEAGSLAVSVSSAGELQPDDVLRPIRRHLGVPSPKVGDMTLGTFLNLPAVQAISRAQQSLPHECEECRFKLSCRGGPLINRFSESEGFRRKSSLCEANKRLFEMAEQFVLAHSPSATV